MDLRLVALAALATFVFGASAGCGGSSSETPPPLEPTPANVHYDRGATTLPGELGTTEQDAGASPPQGGDSRGERPRPGREHDGHEH